MLRNDPVNDHHERPWDLRSAPAAAEGRDQNPATMAVYRPRSGGTREAIANARARERATRDDYVTQHGIACVAFAKAHDRFRNEHLARLSSVRNSCLCQPSLRRVVARSPALFGRNSITAAISCMEVPLERLNPLLEWACPLKPIGSATRTDGTDRPHPQHVCTCDHASRQV